ncbi:MAG: hypothetical protein EOO77_26220 [Oxalobacteraceae bacterium]|nr:MAG: hypothetical protein EOO77_26220 [Oxalobacteraceae bacterium]
MGRGNDWCILRTGASRTLPLVASLQAAGFDVWSPVQTLIRRRGPARERVEYLAPIMPTCVFARADRRHDLARLAALPFTEHPGFSVFRYLGAIPTIGDAEIAEARRIEERGKRAAKMGQRQAFTIGQPVKVKEGPAAGLSGEVVRGGDGKFVLVAFAGINIKIGAWLLGTDEVQDAPIAA